MHACDHANAITRRYVKKIARSLISSTLSPHFPPCFLSEMLLNTIRDSDGEIVTGKTWRKRHGFIKDLPFYSDIPRMEDMAASLQGALSQPTLETSGMPLLVVSPRQSVSSSNHFAPENQPGSRRGSSFQRDTWSHPNSAGCGENAFASFGGG
jgi:hypothetical protein